MADLSKIKLNGDVYNFKDRQARTLIVPVERDNDIFQIQGVTLQEAINAFSVGTRVVLRLNDYDLYIDGYEFDTESLVGTSLNPTGGHVHAIWNETGLTITNTSTLTAEAIGRLVPYGYCITAAATVAKTVTVEPAPLELASGLMIAVKFQYTNTASNPTINVNDFGNIAIKRYGTTAAGTSAAANWNANEVMILVYDGTYWQLASWINTTYSGMTDAEYQAGTSTTNRLISPARLKAAIELYSPQNVSELTNDAGYLTSYTETDPTVPAWAKQSTKPTYTAQEVGALPADTVIPDISGKVNKAGDTMTDDLEFINWKGIKFTSNEYSVRLTATGFTPSQAKVGFNQSTLLQNIATPSANIDAANKEYVDNQTALIKTTAATDNTEYNLVGTVTSNTNNSNVNPYNLNTISFAKTTNEGRLTVGNSSLPGKVRLYSNVTNATGYTDLISGATSTNTRTITFPDATGTVALISDIPSVPSWALAANKPTYTAAEVGATTSSDVSSMISSAVSGITSFSTEIVQTLPATGVAGRIYFKPGDSSTNDIYEEYIYVNNTWEKLGNFDASAINLEDYLKKTDLAEWAKASTKPSYTANEVGALPSNTAYVSTFNGQSGAITYTAPVASVNNQTGAVTLTAANIGASASDHVHGNITNAGDITATAAIASGDRLIINDESASKIINSTITFGSNTNQYLANNGTWQTVPTTTVTQTLTSGTAIGTVGGTTLYAPPAYNDSALAARVSALEAIPWVTYHTGNATPSNSFGNNGDLYLEIS